MKSFDFERQEIFIKHDFMYQIINSDANFDEEKKNKYTLNKNYSFHFIMIVTSLFNFIFCKEFFSRWSKTKKIITINYHSQSVTYY